MADEIDRANDYVEAIREAAIASRKSAIIDPGQPGECDWCGRDTPRLVRGLCAPCRDELGVE